MLVTLVGLLVGWLVGRSVGQSVGKLIGCHCSLLHAAIIGVSTSNKFIMYLQFNYL